MKPLYQNALIFSAILVATAAVTVYSFQRHAAPKGNPEHGHEIAAARCRACHGADGNSPDERIPKIAGLKTEYLYARLQAFKRGSHKSVVMAAQVTGLSDDDLADIAAYFATQTMQPDRPGDPDLTIAGERIFLSGTSNGIVPPCTSCHGRGLSAGNASGGRAVPGNEAPSLAGQHAAYILDQLRRFANGERRYPVMNTIASALTPSDARAVATYLASQQ